MRLVIIHKVSPWYWYRKFAVVPHSHFTSRGRIFEISKNTGGVEGWRGMGWKEVNMFSSHWSNVCADCLSSVLWPCVLKAPSSRLWLQACTAATSSSIHFWERLFLSSKLFASHPTESLWFIVSAKDKNLMNAVAFGIWTVSVSFSLWIQKNEAFPASLPEYQRL